MSEYWVSQAKKFCEFCKCWIADNKPSRDFHEKGKKHQENVKKKIDEVRKKSIKDAKKEEEMEDSIREMNENAMRAFKKDLMKDPALRAQYGIDLKPKVSKAEPVYGPMPRPEGSKDSEDEAESQNKEKDPSEGEDSEGSEEDEGTWHMAASDKGYPYYWNDTTSEVSWVAPIAYLKQQGIPRDEYHKYRSAEDDSKSETKKKADRKKKKKSEPVPPPESGEPEAKKAKVETPEETPSVETPVVNVLPEDIPLPPDSTATKTEDQEDHKDSEDGEDDSGTTETPRQPKSHDSYGTWEQVQTEEPEQLDLGLPTIQKPDQQTVVIPASEPKMKFREKTVSSLGSGPVFFKKPKKKMTAAQFLKKREDS